MMDGRRSQKINLRALRSTHSLAVLVFITAGRSRTRLRLEIFREAGERLLSSFQFSSRRVIKDCEFKSHTLRRFYDTASSPDPIVRIHRKITEEFHNFALVPLASRRHRYGGWFFVIWYCYFGIILS